MTIPKNDILQMHNDADITNFGTVSLTILFLNDINHVLICNRSTDHSVRQELELNC